MEYRKQICKIIDFCCLWGTNDHPFLRLPQIDRFDDAKRVNATTITWLRSRFASLQGTKQNEAIQILKSQADSPDCFVVPPRNDAKRQNGHDTFCGSRPYHHTKNQQKSTRRPPFKGTIFLIIVSPKLIFFRIFGRNMIYISAET